ncbi:MAG: RNA methyltransferase [Planctomycetota bacterium]
MGNPPRKRRVDEQRRDADARKSSLRPELYLILDNVRSLHNVGSIFRTADGFAVRKIFLGGYTPSPPRPEISKTALGAEATVDFEAVSDAALAVIRLKAAGVCVVAVEQADRSSSIYDYAFPRALALVLGHETDGVANKVIELADACVEIPMFGVKHSHNVCVAAGIVLAEVRRQWG